MIFTDI